MLNFKVFYILFTYRVNFWNSFRILNVFKFLFETLVFLILYHANLDLDRKYMQKTNQ